MNNHQNLRLRDPELTPTSEMLEQTLGGSYDAYEALQDALPELEMEQEWQWYTPHKAWFAHGKHFWATPRGTREKPVLAACFRRVFRCGGLAQGKEPRSTSGRRCK